MYRKIEDFIADWKSEESFTIKIFSKITDKIKSYKATENTRTLERLAWHITQTLTEMPFRAGIIDSDFLENKPIPQSFDDIISTYKKHSNELVKLLQEKWTDSELTGKIEVYGQQWERRKILSVLVKHQTHHRGQMTILMRLQNIEVPGTYGPSKEEWSKFGMKPQE
ncbi:MAG: hypothetical protein KAI29_20285 [Cyclobacteriaceae bacterium]|nr:hypothetical protein [Cyclobacteriaceae bacterium]